MSSQTFERLYWMKYTLISLVLGVGIGLVGYNNMKSSAKTTAFETLSNNLEVEEITKEKLSKEQNHIRTEPTYARAN